MDPRRLNESLQELLCRPGNGTGSANGTGTGPTWNGSACDLLRRGLRGPQAPKGESGAGGMGRDGTGRGAPRGRAPEPLPPGVPRPHHRPGAQRTAVPVGARTALEQRKSRAEAGGNPGNPRDPPLHRPVALPAHGDASAG